MVEIPSRLRTFLDLELQLICSFTDTSGPPDSKYCAGGGVYYTYNFVERSDLAGGVGWPWGADVLYKKTSISLNVRPLYNLSCHLTNRLALVDHSGFRPVLSTDEEH